MTIQQKIEAIRANAETVAVQHEVFMGAIEESREASRDLLAAVWAAFRPAVQALSTRMVLAHAKRGCARHGFEPGADVYGDRRGLVVLPSLMVDVDGKWLVDVAAAQTCEDRACAIYEWEEIGLEALVRSVPVAEIVDGLSEVIAAQITRGRTKRAAQFVGYARKLRALADLLTTEFRE